LLIRPLDLLTSHKKKIESVALQRFQFFSWFGFERKALLLITKSGSEKLKSPHLQGSDQSFVRLA
jgi:hypothetical protein